MLSLAQVIQFRASINRLNSTEFNQFIQMFVQKCGRDILITSLFAMFLQSNEQNSTQETLDETLQFIKQIIESRKPKPKPKPKLQAPHASQSSIHSLSSDLIGNLSSFLSFTDYTSLSEVNRMIYIGCNTPNTLHHLDLTKITNYSSIHLAKYCHLKHLAVNMHAFGSFVFPITGTICNRLEQLTVYVDQEIDLDAHPFMSQNAINTNNVTHLNCKWEIGQPNIPVTTFVRFLSNFPNVEHLHVNKVSISPVSVRIPIVESLTPQLLPHLQGLSLYPWVDTTFCNGLLSTFGPKLRALALTDRRLILPTDVSFSHLQELSFFNPQLTTVNNMLKTAQQLRKVCFWLQWSVLRGDLRPTPMKNVMQQLFTNQKYLEFIGVYCGSYDVLRDICKGIEYGLYNRQHPTTHIKINICVFDSEISATPITDILVMITRIINQLRQMNGQSFMFILSLNWKRDQVDDLMAQYELFRNRNPDLHVTCTCVTGQISVSNHGCNSSIIEPFLLNMLKPASDVANFLNQLDDQ